MRALEILTEATLQPSELRKHAGKYLKTLIRKIQDGEPLEITPDKRSRFGDSVVLKASNANKLMNAWFGTTKWPDMEDMNLTPNNDIIPVDSKIASLMLQTTSGDDIPMSALYKTAEYKGGKDFNSGDIGEGALGAAVTAKFLARGKDITEQDVMEIITKLGSGEKEGKNNLKGTTTGKSANDDVYYTLVLNNASYSALVGAATSGEVHPAIKGAIRSSVQFANQNAGVAAALETIMNDKNSNKVTVKADGVSDQKGTKADLFLDVDGSTVNLLSLKAGDVKQFGQASGYNFNALETFFSSTFGVNIDKATEQDFVEGDPVASFEAIHKIYGQVAKRIESELAGDNDPKEAKFVERLYQGVKSHATGGDDNTSMVILKTTPNAPGYVQLKFGPELQKAMAGVDLYLKYDAPGQRKPAKIEVWGKGDQGGDAMLLRMRSNFKSEGKGYVRNIVEMGPLLKILAKIESAAN